MASSFSKDELRKEINGESVKKPRKLFFFLEILARIALVAIYGSPALLLIFCVRFSAILQNSDLEKTSSKEVRNQLQDKLHIDLTSRKKELDKLIMECVNNMQDSSDESASEAESEPEVKPKKRKADSSDESDYKPTKTAKKRRSSGSSEDWQAKKKKTAKKPGGGKYTGFTRPYKLSPELASLMGAKELVSTKKFLKFQFVINFYFCYSHDMRW